MKSRPDLLRSCLRIHDKGQELLEVILEPWARDYWLPPHEVVVVTTTAAVEPKQGQRNGHPDDL
jgi:hypothetical protein